MAPDAGFEPATKWLTATYSTAELIRNELKKWDYREKNIPCQDSVRRFLTQKCPHNTFYYTQYFDHAPSHHYSSLGF